MLFRSISVKLSALHPRYELAKRSRVLTELAPKLLALAQQAKREGIGLTVDAEEADRLELSLDLIEVVFADASRRESLIAAGIQRASAMVITFSDTALALRVLSHVHGLNPGLPVIVRTHDDSELGQIP